MKRIATIAAALLFALVLLPTRALAEEVGGHSRRQDTPLAEPSEQEPVEVGKTVTELTLINLNTCLIPDRTPWFDTRLDPSDPNSAHFDIRYEEWYYEDEGGNIYEYIEGPDKDFGYSPDGYAVEGVTYTYSLYVHPMDGYELANTVTIHYQGKSYKAINRGLSPATEDYISYYKLDIPIKVTSAWPTPLYRMYNTKTSEHLWTRNKAEYNSCGSGNYADWKAEGVAWYAPTSSAKPVYRLYNLKSGDHHYTTSSGERASLVASGQWRDEGVAFYSATTKDTNTIKVYRVYNGRLKRGQHHYTKSAAERDSLVKNNGWRDEGVGFYGFRNAKAG